MLCLPVEGNNAKHRLLLTRVSVFKKRLGWRLCCESPKEKIDVKIRLATVRSGPDRGLICRPLKKTGLCRSPVQSFLETVIQSGPKFQDRTAYKSVWSGPVRRPTVRSGQSSEDAAENSQQVPITLSSSSSSFLSLSDSDSNDLIAPEDPVTSCPRHAHKHTEKGDEYSQEKREKREKAASWKLFTREVTVEAVSK